jgi:hypothetical protein
LKVEASKLKCEKPQTQELEQSKDTLSTRNGNTALPGVVP